MKTNTKIVLAAGAGFLGSWLCSPTGLPQKSTRANINREPHPQTIRARPLPVAAVPAPAAVDREEDASFAEWEARFAVLLDECSSRDAASERLLTELDRRYNRWVEGELASLANTPYVERLGSIADLERSMREGAAAILDHLGIPGERQESVLAASKEGLSAEVQYGMAAPTHQQRLALLRLDREREARLGDLLASAGEAAKMQALSELDTWYDSSLRQISESDELN
jgi:hypothetical protein